ANPVELNEIPFLVNLSLNVITQAAISLRHRFQLIVDKVSQVIFINLTVNKREGILGLAFHDEPGNGQVLCQPISTAQQVPIKQGSCTTPVSIHKGVDEPYHKVNNASLDNGMYEFFLVLVIEEIQKFLHHCRHFRMIRRHVDDLTVDRIYHVYLVICSEPSFIFFIVKCPMSN